MIVRGGEPVGGARGKRECDGGIEKNTETHTH
jgi:hypothetical protein